MPEYQRQEILLDLLNRINRAVQSGPSADTQFYCPHCRCYRFDPWFDRIEAGAYTGFSPGTLAVWDSNKSYDLQPIKFRNLVRYRLSSINRLGDEWLKPF